MKHILSHYWMIRAWAGLDFIRAKNNRTGMTGVSDNDVVFGLGRIFRLERSAIFMTEFWARLELGAINFHLKTCMFTWAKIGSPFEVIILALYSNVDSYHLISTRFLITTSFMISIKWPVDYPIYTNFNEPSHLPCPTSNIGLRPTRQCLSPCGG